MNSTDPQSQQTEAPAPDFDLEEIEEIHLEGRWYVIIHNDDVTPFEYVIRILTNLFLLSDEIADHVAHTAHTEGKAVVVVRPRSEAERLVKVATARARLDGYPLTFSTEPEA
ncbi:MAG: ATP-dependent Clp protease adaptor ClpS [Caldilineaceae bacterium]|nr:ATP-dependent Clp protease adaptor ClpS [Caldilineaceae bacterium]